MSICHRKALSEYVCMWNYTSIPGRALTQPLHEYPASFARVSNTIFLLINVYILIFLWLPCSSIHAHTFLHPDIHGGVVAPVFAHAFAANAFVDKPVSKYFSARVSLNKPSHEYSFASKFLGKFSSVHVSASTCFGICLPIHIWRYTCLKIRIHTRLCMRIQVQRLSPFTFLFYLYLFSLDSAAISIHKKRKQWGRRMPSKQIMALIWMNSGWVFFSWYCPSCSCDMHMTLYVSIWGLRSSASSPPLPMSQKDDKGI